MHIKSKLAAAVMAASMAGQVSAMELGEFNGTSLSIGGYVKAEGVFTQPDDGDNSFDGSVRQTRLNFAMKRDIEGHKVIGFIEGDFWDNNTEEDSSYALRLRHAYINVDNLTIGQTWNGQFWSVVPVDVGAINFFGSGNGTFVGSGSELRPDLVMHYSLGGARFTLQQPYYDDADVPDLVAAYTWRTEGGHVFNVAMSGREVETGVDDSDYGVALAAGAKFKFGNTDVSINGFSGKGAGAYSGWGYNGAKGSLTSDVNADGDMITVTGFSAGVAHQFTDKLKGIVRYGQVTADEFDKAAAFTDDDTLKSTNVTLIYSYLPQLDFGIEWRDLNTATRPPTSASSSLRPAGTQVELMAMYKF
ncbi:hypothetical protein [Marinobacterium lutimaris]|uniref:Outer membrane protein (Porin) n=1 Tax=Marinobacterium lutimaris TaxID=568106 RepID=A0A1H6CQ15_9GAMM|nr:hypothetical protein [Marinobacterium lutimaris]SEG75090.1 Outer membrane protein (porin) [Marinobacterium lutimaris]